MDLTNVDKKLLSEQLRNPTGEMGAEVARMMEKRTEELNMFAIGLLDIQPTDHVLEIGFGPGVAIGEVARLTRHGFAAGIDHSELMLKAAESRNHRDVIEERMELTLGTADELPYRDASFDKVFAANVFHFWSDPSKELAECLRVLKSGGVLLFVQWHPASMLYGVAGTGVFTMREPEDIARILRDAGLDDVAIRDQTFEGGRGFAVWGTKT